MTMDLVNKTSAFPVMHSHDRFQIPNMPTAFQTETNHWGRLKYIPTVHTYVQVE